MMDTFLPRGESYHDVYARFRWTIPSVYNIAVDACDRHADDRSRVAMVYEDDAGSISEHTFAEFRARSNQLARVFAGLGLERGDRVGIVLPQRPETAVAHLASFARSSSSWRLASRNHPRRPWLVARCSGSSSPRFSP